MELSDVRPRARDDERILPGGSVHSPGSLFAFLRKRLEQGGLEKPAPTGKAVSTGEGVDDLALLHDDESMDFLEGVFGVRRRLGRYSSRPSPTLIRRHTWSPN